MATAGAETNVPLLVAGVFAATFLVVGAIAYLMLFRQSSARVEESVEHARPAQVTKPVETPEADVASGPSPQFSLPLDEPASDQPHGTVWESVSISAGAPAPEAAGEPPPDGSQKLLVRLYRALMFATGVAGLLASALMFSAVEGLSLLPFVALLVAAFSVYSIYRGFVPDRELRARPPK